MWVSDMDRECFSLQDRENVLLRERERERERVRVLIINLNWFLKSKAGLRFRYTLDFQLKRIGVGCCSSSSVTTTPLLLRKSESNGLIGFITSILN